MKKISFKIIALVAVLVAGIILAKMLWPEKAPQKVEKPPPGVFDNAFRFTDVRPATKVLLNPVLWEVSKSRSVQIGHL